MRTHALARKYADAHTHTTDGRTGGGGLWLKWRLWSNLAAQGRAGTCQVELLGY